MIPCSQSSDGSGGRCGRTGGHRRTDLGHVESTESSHQPVEFGFRYEFLLGVGVRSGAGGNRRDDAATTCSYQWPLLASAPIPGSNLTPLANGSISPSPPARSRRERISWTMTMSLPLPQPAPSRILPAKHLRVFVSRACPSTWRWARQWGWSTHPPTTQRTSPSRSSIRRCCSSSASSPAATSSGARSGRN